MYVFYDYFLHGSSGPSYVKQILSGVKNSNDSLKQDTTIFHLYSGSCEHSGLVCEKAEAGGDVALSNFSW